MTKLDTVCSGFHWNPATQFVRAAGRLAETDLTVLWRKGIRMVLSLLILTILAGLAGGVVKTFLDLRLLFYAAVEVALRQVIIDTLVLLALVEVFKNHLRLFLRRTGQGDVYRRHGSGHDADRSDLPMV